MAVAKQLGTCLQRVRRQDQLSRQNDALRQQLRLESELVGESPPMRFLAEQIKRVAPTNATVLIRGESGAGKELISRAIHHSSLRKEAPFVTLNCAALTETLLESELFGHEKGAFTGATDKKIGKFEAADKGTIFLDEIGEMSPSTQAKFLRVLEGHAFERVGGHTAIRADVRVLSATNTPLEKAVHEGKFRRDLFFRLQVVEIQAPPLRDRMEDVPLLAEHFLKRFVHETGRRVRGFTPLALQKLQDYHWPGNVRELRNVVERAVALGTGALVDAHDIWLSALDEKRPVSVLSGSYRAITLEELERRYIIETLVFTDWNKTQAAGILGIERSTLDRKIRSLELKKAE
jgi:Nif-specific regulatory protein